MGDILQACMIKTINDSCKGAVRDDDAILALMRNGFTVPEIKTNLDPVLDQVRASRAPELAAA